MHRLGETHSPLHGKVISELRQAILNQRLKPGERLIEGRLAEELRCARGGLSAATEPPAQGHNQVAFGGVKGAVNDARRNEPKRGTAGRECRDQSCARPREAQPRQSCRPDEVTRERISLFVVGSLSFSSKTLGANTPSR